MVTKGARNLVLLSRSGPQSSKLVSFLEELRRDGATVYTPRCNIADAASLQEVVAHCEAHMPPIKGCIQAAMDIKVSQVPIITATCHLKRTGAKLSKNYHAFRTAPSRT